MKRAYIFQAAFLLALLGFGRPPGLSLRAQQTTSSRIQMVEPTPPATGATAPTAAKRRDHVTLKIDAAATDWTDTGIDIFADDTLTFLATGEIVLAGHTLSPDGMVRGWRDMLRHFPVDSANAGALVGRIGNSAAAVPFPVGSQQTVTTAQSGRLYLRVNTSAELPATGSVKVDLRLAPSTSAMPASTRATGAALPADHTATPLLTALSPAMLDSLPRRVADRDGSPGDAINFALIGTETQVRDAFARAGWVTVDTDTRSAVLHGLLNTLEHKPYVEVPMSTLYLFGRPQDLSFARATAISVATERHHLRCWQTDQQIGGQPLWVGAATHDVGLERDERNGNITHRIAPEIDLERDFLRESFQMSGASRSAAYFSPANPLHTARTATGGTFTTDGRVLLLQLR